MVTPPSASERSSAATLAGLPRRLAFSLLTIVCWIFFTLGLVPLIAYVARSPRLKGGSEHRAGIGWALLTDILGGTGNIAFFRAPGVRGQASVVVPATALFLVMTVILAVSFLRERPGREQKARPAVALVAIYLLSTA